MAVDMGNGKSNENDCTRAALSLIELTFFMEGSGTKGEIFMTSAFGQIKVGMG